MKNKKQQLQSPKKPKEWVRLYTYRDKSKESSQALKLLREAGYRVISFPDLSQTFRPELKVGRRLYRGLEEIKKFIEENKNTEGGKEG